MKEETLDGLRNLAEAKEQRLIDSPEYNALEGGVPKAHGEEEEGSRAAREACEKVPLLHSALDLLPSPKRHGGISAQP